MAKDTAAPIKQQVNFGNGFSMASVKHVKMSKSNKVKDRFNRDDKSILIVKHKNVLLGCISGVVYVIRRYTPYTH